MVENGHSHVEAKTGNVVNGFKIKVLFEKYSELYLIFQWPNSGNKRQYGYLVIRR